MTAVEHEGGAVSERPHPLRRGAEPATVHAWLRPEDRDRFASDYRAALDEARRNLMLNGVHDVVESYRQLAVLQSDPVGFRRTVRALAETVTGHVPPEDEPLEVTRVVAGI